MEIVAVTERLEGRPVQRVVEQCGHQVVADLLRPVYEEAEGLVLRGEVTGPDDTGTRVHADPAPPLARPGSRPLAATPDLVGTHHATIGDPHHVLVAHQRVRVLRHQAHGGGGGQGATLRRSQVAASQLPIHTELQEGTCALNRRPQRIGVGSGQVAGVAALG